MTNQSNSKTLAQWKEKARESLSALTAEVARRMGVDIATPITRRRDSAFLQKATLVFDPITVTVEDAYGGTLSCTYDISPTLSGLRKEFQKMEVSDSKIAAFADSEKDFLTSVYRVPVSELVKTYSAYPARSCKRKRGQITVLSEYRQQH